MYACMHVCVYMYIYMYTYIYIDIYAIPKIRTWLKRSDSSMVLVLSIGVTVSEVFLNNGLRCFGSDCWEKRTTFSLTRQHRWMPDKTSGFRA